MVLGIKGLWIPCLYPNANLPLARPLSLPGAQRGFALHPPANFPERLARVLPGLSKLTDFICGDDKRTAWSYSSAKKKKKKKKKKKPKKNQKE